MNQMVGMIIAEIEAADVIIAPIADNKVFYMMAQSTEGEINVDVALHLLSASEFQLKSITCLILNVKIAGSRLMISFISKIG